MRKTKMLYAALFIALVCALVAAILLGVALYMNNQGNINKLESRVRDSEQRETQLSQRVALLEQAAQSRMNFKTLRELEIVALEADMLRDEISLPLERLENLLVHIRNARDPR